MSSPDSTVTNYRYVIVANTVVPATSSGRYTELAEFVEAACTGAVVHLFRPTASSAADDVAALVARGVQHVSLVVYVHWPGLLFEPELRPMLDGPWKLGLYTADQWGNGLEGEVQNVGSGAESG